jgi:hypothetical protein
MQILILILDTLLQTIQLAKFVAMKGFFFDNAIYVISKAVTEIICQ